MTLEEKIKQLMEAKSEQSEELLSEESIEELDEAKVKMNKDGAVEVDSDSDKEDDHQEPDEDDEGGESDNDEDNEDDSETDVANDTGKKDKVAVKEAATPGQGKDLIGGSEEGAASDNSHIKAGVSKKDAAPGKLSADASADKQEDNGDNAKIKAKVGTGDKGGKVAGSTGGAANADQARNAVDKNPVGVKEHMDALFNGEELSEEFQSKAATIFEAAVEQVAQDRIDALTEEYAQQVVALKEEMEVQLNEAVEEVRDELIENIDGFLNVVVEQWIEDNQVGLESGMKVELVNSFIDGMKNLFKEHYIEVPDEKLDIIEEQARDIEEFATGLSALEEQNKELQNELNSLKSALIFEDVSDTLTDVQVEKFKEIVENVEFTTVEEYQVKLETLKENYFPKGQTIVTENTTVDVTDETMSKYVKAVASNLKFK